MTRQSLRLQPNSVVKVAEGGEGGGVATDITGHRDNGEGRRGEIGQYRAGRGEGASI